MEIASFEELKADFNLSLELLEKVQKAFIKKTELTPMMATELEFFFMPNEDRIFSKQEQEEITASISSIAKNHGIKIQKTGIEIGKNQFEVSFHKTDNLLKLAKDVQEIKKIITHIAPSYNSSVSFESKPYGDLCVGNSMQIHLSLWDKEHNVFQKKSANITSKYLLNSIAGLLESFNDSIYFFVDSNKDLSRFKAKIFLPQEEKRYKPSVSNAPTNISWGYNNRTVLLRIPNNNMDKDSIRIEHRAPSSNCNLPLAMLNILYFSFYGIKNNLTAPEPIWGNAFDEQYSNKVKSFDFEGGKNNTLGIVEKISDFCL